MPPTMGVRIKAPLAVAVCALVDGEGLTQTAGRVLPTLGDASRGRYHHTTSNGYRNRCVGWPLPRTNKVDAKIKARLRTQFTLKRGPYLSHFK